MKLDPHTVERRLRNAVADQREAIDPPSGLDRRIMHGLEGPDVHHRNVGLIQQLAIASILILFAGALSIGISKLRANNAPAKPKSVTRIIPWVDAPAGPTEPNFSIEERVSPLQAALMIKANVTELGPVMLPSRVASSAIAIVTVQPNTFTVEYQMNNSTSVALMIATPQLDLPAANLSQQGFRGVIATYAVSDPQHPEQGQFLMWTEPGSSANNGQGVPYFLKVGGLTRAQFWQVADSIGPVPDLNSLARPCAAADLQAIFNGNTAGTGNVWGNILASNRSATPCMLNGTPNMQLIEPNGRVLRVSENATQFGSPLIMPALLEPNSAPPVEQVAVKGEASLTFELGYCPGPLPTIESIRLILPDNAGTVIFPASTSGPYVQHVGSQRCDPGTPPHQDLGVGPFVSTTNLTVVGERLVARISAPRSVRAGSALHYTVTLTNTSAAPFVLSPCPAYTEFIGQKLGYARYQVNCGAVGPIGPGASATFAMVLQVPAGTPAGQQRLEWISDAGATVETVVDVS